MYIEKGAPIVYIYTYGYIHIPMPYLGQRSQPTVEPYNDSGILRSPIIPAQPCIVACCERFGVFVQAPRSS